MLIPPAVILVRPREEGNVGAVARAMANMGLERLILVEPAPSLGGIARGFGVGGWEILDRVERAASFRAAAATFGRLVATASRRERPLRRSRVVTPRRLPEILAADPAGTRAALVFGSEDNGLKRNEIDLCDPVVTVPCEPGHPTLNLAQAVLILAYELRGAGSHAGDGAKEAEHGTDRAPLASVAELDALESRLSEILLAVGYDHEPIHAGLLRDLRRLTVRAMPSSREVRILRRLCNRASAALAVARDDRVGLRSGPSTSHSDPQSAATFEGETPDESRHPAASNHLRSDARNLRDR